VTGCMGRGFPEHYVASEPSRKAQSRGYVGVSAWCGQAARTEAETVLELVPRTGGETEAQRIIDGCTKDYTVVREEDYCDLDGSRIVSGLKCPALVDIQEETEFPETLCVCGSVRLRLWHVRRDFVAIDFLEDDVFSVT